MPLISGTIPSLVNGISQQPATLRMPTQGELQENAFSHVSRGLEKRPCTEHVSTIAGITSTTSNDVFIHTIRRSEEEAYALIIKGGTTDGLNGAEATVVSTVKLYDLTGFATGVAGTEVFIHPTVQTGAVSGSGSLDANVNNYLANFGSTNSFIPSKLSSTTIADFTFILNNTQKIKKTTTGGLDSAVDYSYHEHHDTRQYEAMIHFRVGDYGTTYKIETKEYDVDVDGELDKDLDPLSSFTSSYTTPDNKVQSITGDNKETVSKNNHNAVIIKNIAKTFSTGTQTHIPTGTYGGASDPGYTAPPAGSVINQGTFTGQAINTATFNAAMSDITISSIAFATVDGVSTATATTSAAHGLSVGDTITVTGVTPSTYNGSFTTIAGTTDTQVVYVLGSTPSGTGGTGTIAKRQPWTVTYTDDESTIVVTNSGKPFVIEVTDGKGDTYVRAINGSDEVSNFSHLPGTKVPLNFNAKVSGDTETGQDDYYVRWNGTVWKESAKPKHPSTLASNVRKSLDSKTMPVQMFKEFDVNNKIYFVLKPIAWQSRIVGDDSTNPFPSFANYDEVAYPDGLYTINDIFFHANRLGFISDENVILSESATYFNFFATTVLTVLDTAVIDVAVSNNQVAILNSAVPFQENLLLFSDLQQFKLTSPDFLTPTSVMIDVASGFETSSIAKPVPAGKTIFFPFKRGSYSGIREYMIDQNTNTNDANEITTHIPNYIEGTVQKLAVSSNEETLLVLSDSNRKELFIYKYYYADQEKLQSSWSKWVFDADILDMAFIGSIGFILFRRGTSIYLEKINLSVDNATTIMDDKIGVRLDRRVKLEATELADITPTVVGGAWATTATDQTAVTGSSSGSGTGMTFTIRVDNEVTSATGNPTIYVTNNGTGYAVGDTVTIIEPGVSVLTAVVTISSLGTKHSLADYYTDHSHDAVVSGTDTCETKSDPTASAPTTLISQQGSELTIDGFTNIPRIGQTFTWTHEVNTTYTVVDVGIVLDNTCTIEITPSIGSEPDLESGQGGPVPNNTVLTFKERLPVYVAETGQVISEAQVASVLQKGTPFSISDSGNSTPVIFAGIPYEFKYRFSEQFVKANDNSVNSGRLQMRNFEISYDRTIKIRTKVW